MSASRSGWFDLDRELSTSPEARVFTCVHAPAHRTYLFKMSRDASQKVGGQLPSTGNVSLELPHLRATTKATAALYPKYFARPRDSSGDRYVFPEYFGILDQRYLVPASATYRTRDAIPFEDILATPPEVLCLYPFWDNLWLLLQTETSLVASADVPFETWQERWQHLVHESHLGRQLLRTPPAECDDRLMREISTLIEPDPSETGPCFEESAILRMIAMFTGRQLTTEQAAASLACPFFRLNITVQDLHYAVALADLARPRPWLFQDPVEWLGPSLFLVPTLLEGLVRQPLAIDGDVDAFEQCSPPDESSLSRFTHLLQDPERAVRPYVALVET